jgi:hypothetical protein
MNLVKSQMFRVGQLWHNALQDKSWRKSDRAKLDNIAQELQNNHLHLRKLRFLLGELLANRFFSIRMAATYAKYDKELKIQVQSLEAILAKRKEILSAMRSFYFAKQRFKLKDGTIVECEIGSSKAGNSMQEILGRYSYGLVDDQFDRSVIKNIAAEIDQELNSSSAAELKNGIDAFLSSLERSEFDESEMAELIDEAVFNLIGAGHSEADLEDVATSLSLPVVDERETRKILEPMLRAPPAKWIILTSLEDLSLPDDKDIEIGNVTLHGMTHDFSSICDGIQKATIENAVKEVETTIKENAIKEVKKLQGKVSAELVALAYGSKEACEKAVQGISKTIDVLAMHDPNFVVREPREQPLHKMTALDSNHGMLPSQTLSRRLEISIKKELNDNAIQRLQNMLQRIDQLLKKEADDLNELERRILNAMHFYRKGNYAFDPIDKVVNYFVALECMLILSGERPSSSLPTRVLDILGVMQENAKEMRDLVEQAYRHRGEILHLGSARADVSDQIASSLLEVDRRVLAILVDHIQDSRCDSLEHFLAVIHEETIANREENLRNALFEINKEYLGEGLLKTADGVTMGQVEFSVAYKDDGKYTYMLGSISKFKALGTLSAAAQSIEEIRFAERTEKFRIKLVASLHPFELFELLRGRTESIRFQATELSNEAVQAI